MGMERRKMSVIVPCYNEEEVLSEFMRELGAVCDRMPQYTFEWIFVDDGSSDGTLRILREAAERDGRVRYLSFSRNFGKESAIYAGLEHSNGDYTAVMDADLQDPPALLPEMAEALESGEYDCAATMRVDRKGEPPVRSFFASCFYKLMRIICPEVDLVDGARDYRLMNRKMVDSILALKEYDRFSKGIFGWVGFRIKWISFENVKRAAGETKWSFWKLFRYSIEGIVAFTTAPLTFAALTGLFFCAVAFFMIVVVIVRKLLFGDPVSGWASLVCIMLMLGGLVLFHLGIIGKYIANIYREVKRRPIYLIRETDEELNREKSAGMHAETDAGRDAT